jgi:hypothetical protein
MSVGRRRRFERRVRWGERSGMESGGFFGEEKERERERERERKQSLFGFFPVCYWKFPFRWFFFLLLRFCQSLATIGATSTFLLLLFIIITLPNERE